MKVDISLAFSLVAIIISVVVPGIEYFRDYKLNRVNLEADYYRKIYAEHLEKIYLMHVNIYALIVRVSYAM